MTSVANMNDGGGRTTEAVRQNWGWFLVLGIALVLCGAVAILLPLLSTYAASLVIGVAVAVGGVAHIIHAFRSKGWSGFFWDLLKALPVAEEVIGDDQRSKTDIRRPFALLNDLLYDADSGPLGEALRPMYVDYLLEHEGSEAPDATEGRDDA